MDGVDIGRRTDRPPAQIAQPPCQPRTEQQAAESPAGQRGREIVTIAQQFSESVSYIRQKNLRCGKNFITTVASALNPGTQLINQLHSKDFKIEQEKPRTDYPVMDLIRFAAAFMVAGFHLFHRVWLPDYFGGNPELLRVGEALHHPFRWGAVGVPIFFTLSGFVIAFSADGRSAGAFARSRILRLFPAAWICASLTLTVRWGETGVAGDYLRSLVLWPTGPWIDGVYWTLGIELVFYAAIICVLLAKVPLERIPFSLDHNRMS
jgi:hypothetical protein